MKERKAKPRPVSIPPGATCFYPRGHVCPHRKPGREMGEHKCVAFGDGVLESKVKLKACADGAPGAKRGG